VTKKVIKTDEEWREILTPEQYRVARQKGTERAFTGEYYDAKDEGTYKCVGCGNELFTSEAKFDSGCGWPSFTEPAAAEKVRTETDYSHGMQRTEVLCAACDAHLGHVFDDGPRPTNLRYCINSVVLDLDKKE
jgi:peptide-methionine (R)-S-oxide reductase